MGSLVDYGFQTYYSKLGKYEIDEDRVIARIIAQHKGRYSIVCGNGVVTAELSGNYLYLLQEKGGYPVVGDYVYINGENSNIAIIQDLLPRVSMF